MFLCVEFFVTFSCDLYADCWSASVVQCLQRQAAGRGGRDRILLGPEGIRTRLDRVAEAGGDLGRSIQCSEMDSCRWKIEWNDRQMELHVHHTPRI